MDVNGFTVCVLLYGDHLPYAKRVLGSILATATVPLVRSLRVGMNAVSADTRQWVYAQLRAHACLSLVYDSQENRYKYPMMRRMLYDPNDPVITPWVMWFDDDSYLAGNPDWWETAYQVAQTAELVGEAWRIRLQPAQITKISQQPWYRGQSL